MKIREPSNVMYCSRLCLNVELQFNVLSRRIEALYMLQLHQSSYSLFSSRIHAWLTLTDMLDDQTGLNTDSGQCSRKMTRPKTCISLHFTEYIVYYLVPLPVRMRPHPGPKSSQCARQCTMVLLWSKAYPRALCNGGRQHTEMAHCRLNQIVG